MFLKVNKYSALYVPLSDIFNKEQEREKNYHKWQKDNLPEFDDTLLERSSYEIYGRCVGWEFKGEFDSKTWRPVKGFDGFYEPNKRTKAGKAMIEAINNARGDVFIRLDFFDIFHTNIPYFGGSFIVPNGFVYNNEIYMMFDDANYNDIRNKCSGQYEEITYERWDDAYNNYINDKFDS